MRTIMNKTRKHICASDESRKELLNKLYGKALKCGLITNISNDGGCDILTVAGSKGNMIKYFLLTMFDGRNVIDGVRSLFNVMLTF